MSRSKKRKLYDEEHIERRLREISEELADLMCECGGSAAMARTYVERKTGEPMIAANFYAKSFDVSHDAPIVAFREMVE